MISFGDPHPFAKRIAAAGAQLLFQVQRLEQLPMALEAGASVIIGQGGEAGGIADGRTLAAARVLGADGALVGSCLWATRESLAAPGATAQAVEVTGDATARSSVFDILRRKNWPAPYATRPWANRWG